MEDSKDRGGYSVFKWKLPSFLNHQRMDAAPDETDDDKMMKMHPSSWYGRKAKDNTHTKPAMEYGRIKGERIQSSLAVICKQDKQTGGNKKSWREILKHWSEHIEDEPEDIIPFPYVHPQASWCVRKLTVHVSEYAKDLKTFLMQCGIMKMEEKNTMSWVEGKEANEPIRLQIKPEVFQNACEEMGSDASKCEYQFIPVKFTMDRYSSQGMEFGGGVSFETRDKDDSFTVCWGTHHAMVMKGDKKGMVSTGVSIVRDRLNENMDGANTDIYDAIVEHLAEDEAFMKWAPMNMEKEKLALRGMKNGNYYEILVPAAKADKANDVLQWLAISHYPRVLQFLSEEEEAGRYSPGDNGVDPENEESWYTTSSNEKIRMPVDLMNEILTRVDEAVNPTSNLLCVTHGVDVLFRPTESWKKAVELSKARDHNMAKQISLSFDLTFLVIPCKWHDRA